MTATPVDIGNRLLSWLRMIFSSAYLAEKDLTEDMFRIELQVFEVGELVAHYCGLKRENPC